MLPQQPSQAVGPKDQFSRLCAGLEEYEHLPELIPGERSTRLITQRSPEDTIDESILAGLTQP